MAVSYFQSTQVAVFPCAYRGQNTSGYIYNPESRGFTEQNFTINIHGLNSAAKPSYLLSWDNGNSNAGVLKCVIGGYYFKITGVQYSDLAGKTLAIKTRSVNINDNSAIDVTQVLAPYATDALDGLVDTNDGLFCGLAKVDSNDSTNLASATDTLELIDDIISLDENEETVHTYKIKENTRCLVDVLTTDTGTGAFKTAGTNSSAAGNYAVAIGQTAKADGLHSFAFGDRAEATEEGSVAIGKTAKSKFANSFALGKLTEAAAADQVIIGVNTKADTTDAFVVGNNGKKLAVDKTGNLELRGNIIATGNATNHLELGLEDANKNGSITVYGDLKDAEPCYNKVANSATFDSTTTYYKIEDDEYVEDTEVTEDNFSGKKASLYTLDTTNRGKIFDLDKDGNLKIAGNTKLCGNLDITGNTVTVARANTTNSLTLGSTDENCAGSLTIYGDDELPVFAVDKNGNTALTGTFNVDGNTTIGGDTTISGEVTIADDVNIAGYTTLNSGLSVDGKTLIYNDLECSFRYELDKPATENFTDPSGYVGKYVYTGTQYTLVNADSDLAGLTLPVATYKKVTSGIECDGKLEVGENARIKGELTSDSTTTLATDTITATRGALPTPNAEENERLPNTIRLNGNTTNTGTFTANGNINLAENLLSITKASGNTPANAAINCATNVNGDLTVNGDISITGNTLQLPYGSISKTTFSVADEQNTGGTLNNTDAFTFSGTSSNIAGSANNNIGIHTAGRLSCAGDFFMGTANEPVGVHFTPAGHAFFRQNLVVGEKWLGMGAGLNNIYFIIGKETGENKVPFTKVKGSLAVGTVDADDTLDTGDLKVTGRVSIDGGLTIGSGNKAFKIEQLSDDDTWSLNTKGTITAQSYIATSDRRLKQNIKDYTCEKSILNLQVKEFEYIDDNNHIKHIGCIAQDLQEICPELVHEDANGYLSIEENKLVYLLLQEVKNLKKEIKELKGE